jgi:tellurite resistance protein
VIVFLVIGLLVSGLLMGQWLTGGLEEQSFGPAFFLPGIGIGFVGADGAASVGLHGIAELFFGVGVASWVLIGSVTLNRMFFRPRLAPSLFPTMAIELAPAAVAGNAYFVIHTGSPDLLLFAAGSSAYAWALIAGITILVSSIAARTILAAARGQLLPSPGGAAALLPSPAAAPLRRAA